MVIIFREIQINLLTKKRIMFTQNLNILHHKDMIYNNFCIIDGHLYIFCFTLILFIYFILLFYSY